MPGASQWKTEGRVILVLALGRLKVALNVDLILLFL